MNKKFTQAIQIQVPDKQFTHHQAPQRPNLPINDALQIQAAELWLELGEADLALKELEKPPTRIWRCRWALKTRIAAGC
jgi:hypothetical protein